MKPPILYPLNIGRYFPHITFWLFYERYHASGKVWGVRVGNRWYRANHIDVRVPCSTVYRGPDAAQPRAYLRGRASKVERRAGTVVIK